MHYAMHNMQAMEFFHSMQFYMQYLKMSTILCWHFILLIALYIKISIDGRFNIKHFHNIIIALFAKNEKINLHSFP
jgi:hypothetical protein